MNIIEIASNIYKNLDLIKGVKVVIKKYCERAIAEIYKQREKILKAFIAETGCLPSEAVIVEEYKGNKIIWSIEKKNNKDSQGRRVKKYERVIQFTTETTE